jgi:uncharacterized membrane protein
MRTKFRELMPVRCYQIIPADIQFSQNTSIYIEYFVGTPDEPQISCNRAMLCQLFNSTYNLKVEVVNNSPSFSPSITSYNEEVPIAAPIASPNSTAPSNYPFVAIQESLYAYLIGFIQDGDRSNTTVRLEMTNLHGDGYSYPHLSTEVPELMANLTISALSISNITSGATCTTTVQENIYLYNRFVLFLAYGCAVALALVGLFIGVRAAWNNGIPTGSIFSQLLVTVSLSLTMHG